MCDILASRLIEKDKLEELSAFVELPSDFVSEEELSDLLYGWLSNRDSSENLLAVKQFIQSLESYPFKTSPAETVTSMTPRAVSTSGLSTGTATSSVRS